MYEYFHHLKPSTYLNISIAFPLSLVLDFLPCLISAEFLFNFNMNLKSVTQKEFTYTQWNFINVFNKKIAGSM